MKKCLPVTPTSKNGTFKLITFFYGNGGPPSLFTAPTSSIEKRAKNATTKSNGYATTLTTMYFARLFYSEDEAFTAKTPVVAGSSTTTRPAGTEQLTSSG